jgi:large subunit ribosomal protein L17
MHHGISGSNLSRDIDDRTALRKNLLRDLFLRGSITTTLAKAKAIRSEAEKLITKAKRSTKADLIRIQSTLGDKRVIRIILADAKDRYTGRTSGYTRIVRFGVRKGDNAELVQLSFVDEKKESKPVLKTKKESKKELDVKKK